MELVERMISYGANDWDAAINSIKCYSRRNKIRELLMAKKLQTRLANHGDRRNTKPNPGYGEIYAQYHSSIRK